MATTFVQKQGNPNNYTVYGQSVVDGGLCVQDGISGIGLLTFGLIWGSPEIWMDSQISITTAWADSNSVITTSWTNSNSIITTTWTDSIFGPYGEALS